MVSSAGFAFAFAALAGIEAPVDQGAAIRSPDFPLVQIQAARGPESWSMADRLTLQKLLKARGDYTGPVNGTLGQATRDAVARFQRDIGERPTGVMTDRQFDALYRESQQPRARNNARESAPSSGPKQAGVATGPVFFDWLEGVVPFGSDRAELARELTKRIMAASPDSLAHEERAADWLRTLARPTQGPAHDPAMAPLARSFESGTEFDRRRALTAFRETMAARASNDPLTVKRVRRVVVGAYDPKAGSFPLQSTGGEGAFGEEMRLGWGSSPNVTLVVENWAQPDALPLPAEAAERFAARLGSARYVDVVLTLQIGALESTTRSGTARIQAATRLLAAEVHAMPGQRSERLGPRIASLSIDKPAAATAPVLPALAANAGNEAIFSTLGLPMVGSAIRFPTHTNDRAHEAPMSNLFKLLRLKANPGLLDDASATHHFISVVGLPAAAEFLRPPAYAGDLAEHMLVERDWRGRDQFEKEDSRQRFLARHKARILSLVPALPFRAVVFLNVPLTRYDANRGGFDLTNGYGDGRGRNNLWGEPGTAGSILGSFLQSVGRATVAAPVHFPTFLSMDENGARELKQLERQLAQVKTQLTGYVHFDVTQVRRGDRAEILIDTVFVDQGIAQGREPSRTLIRLPETINVAAPPFTSRHEGAFTTLNAETARLLAAKIDPQLLQDQTFARNSLQVRRDVERQMHLRGAEATDGSSWPLSLPNTLIQTQTGILDGDVAGYTQWAQRRVGEVTENLRIKGLRPNRGRFDLTKAFQSLQVGRVQNVGPDLTAAVQAKFPNAVGVVSFPGMSDLPVVIVLHPNQAWFDAGVDAGATIDPLAYADFKLLKSEMLSVGGQKTLALELTPVSVGSVGGEARSAILTPKPAQPRSYQYDILGVKLGDDVDGALKKLVAAFPDFDTAHVDVQAGRDPALPNFVQLDVGKEGEVHDRFFLAYDRSDRFIYFIKRAYGPAQRYRDDQQLNSQLSRLIVSKYGPQHRAVSGIVGAWMSDPVHRARIDRATGCYGYVGTLFDASYFGADFLTDRCGETLLVQVAAGRAAYMLFDSTRVVNVRQQVKTLRQAPLIDGTASRL